MDNSPPQSDTVVEVSDRMRKLVEDFELHRMRGDPETLPIVRTALLREIAKLEEKAWKYDDLCK